MSTVRLGSSNIGTTFPDVIINTVEGTATNRIAGFAQVVHNPGELKTVVDVLAQNEIPSVFADAVLLRRHQLQQINDVWDFPLAASIPNTCPLPWTIVEATEKSALNGFRVEYNIMRTLDFIGRNILRLELPSVSLFNTNLKNLIASGDVKTQAQNMYLGAWYRDLIPRIVQKIDLYPRSASHELFSYSGYCIYIHNLIFGNERKAMNDLMAGEDKFELCYDPYRVDGSALGLNSLKGMDVYSNYDVMSTSAAVNGFRASNARVFTANNANAYNAGQDTLVDYFQRNDLMDIKEFNEVYRKNVYYEAPVAQNYHARHSIHSRRVIHAAKSINVPLDILPFSHDLSSALSTASLAGECGYIRLTIYNDWTDRAFYCTKISNIAPSHPIPNHLHYQIGDNFEYINTLGQKSVGTIAADSQNQMVGWVNVESLGRFGDSQFKRAATANEENDNQFNNSQAYSVPGSIVGNSAMAENVIPSKITFDGANTAATMAVPGTAANATLRTANTTYNSTLQRDPTMNYANAQAAISNAATVSSAELIASILNEDQNARAPIVLPLKIVDPEYDTQVKNALGVRLFQIGFQTLECISALLTKLPNIYITTEWSEIDTPITPLQNFEININNDLYHIADVFWFIPKDNYGIESMRVYPPHMINHEAPLINTMVMKTQLDQGVCVYDWDMLNIVNPAFMGLNPLQENIGIVSFSPQIHANQYPLAYYDPNIAGEIRCTFQTGRSFDDNLVGSDRYSVNLKNGILKTITLGINGIVSCNLNLFRLVF